jgi:hypothetical protein
MVELTKIADLGISAASGLIALADRLCVVADDELFLALYDFTGCPQARIDLFAAVLPEAHAERKAQKPDLEALTELPDGRLLALGSGSTDARMRAVLIDPADAWSVRAIDLAPLYSVLRARLPELNIEGAAVHAGRLWLAQRGNGASSVNACIELDLHAAWAGLDSDAAWLPPESLRAVHAVALGSLDGVELGFTDLCAHPHAGLLFSAAAETGGSTYEDGVCTGSVLGALSVTGQVRSVVRVAPRCKVEGIATTSSIERPIALWLVADPDDRAQRAPLFRCEFDLD